METTRGQLTKLRQELQPNDKKIDRSTRYGNEFQIEKPHPDTGLPMTRDDVCDLFEERQLPSMDVEPLRGKRLLCWCKPHERCHGDSIIKKLDETKHMIGHNSNALAPLVKKAQNGLAQVKKGEETTIEGWLMYGEALNEGREQFPSDEQFGQWIVSANLSGTNDHDRLAAMWAAANPDEFHQTKEDNPKVRTVRGLHSKWKKAQKGKVKDDENDTEQNVENSNVVNFTRSEDTKPPKPKEMSLDELMREPGDNWDSYTCAGALVSCARDLHLQEGEDGMERWVMEFLESRKDKHSHSYNAAGLVALSNALNKHKNELKEMSVYRSNDTGTRH